MWKKIDLLERRIHSERKTVDKIKIENERDKNLYMQGYEQALKDVNLDKFFSRGIYLWN